VTLVLTDINKSFEQFRRPRVALKSHCLTSSLKQRHRVANIFTDCNVLPKNGVLLL